MIWSETAIHFIDFEGSTQSGILEYGVATLKGGEIVFTEDQFCAPVGSIRAIETKNHGLRKEELLTFPPFYEFLDRFVNLRKEGLFAAHNIHVEKNLLAKVEAFPGVVPTFTSDEEVCSWGPWIDSLALYRLCYPSLESYKLSHLLTVFRLHGELEILAQAHCKKGRRKFHCALFDALGSALLVKRLISLPEFQSMTLDWLVRHATSKNPVDENDEQTFLDFS